eukprot:TRINITY_DN23801_c1_g1_i1.p1 TRINITY_DN23801_c1_g1~~TRINITY_DN23801_c1_g1_i1.p1  ORF type:complete len:855 (+),score=125.64 TRINITY_DN23801_c1_g1_i1:276-2567(+)
MENDLRLKDLHMNCQQWNEQLPVAFTSTKTGTAQYTIFPDTVRVVTSLEACGADDCEFSLHPKCKGARHYIALSDNMFYLIFDMEEGSGQRYLGARTSCLRNATDWQEFDIPSSFHAADAIMFDDHITFHEDDVNPTDAESPRSVLSVSQEGSAVAEAAFHFSCGDARAAGYYKRIGWRNGRPEYCRLDDDEAMIYWNSAGEWISYVEGYKASSTLYVCFADSSSVPHFDWEIEEGEYPAPSLTRVAIELDFRLQDASEGSRFVRKLESAAKEVGVALPPIDRSMLSMLDASGHAVSTDREPDWSSLHYPVHCKYSVANRSDRDLASSFEHSSARVSSVSQTSSRSEDSPPSVADPWAGHEIVGVLRGSTLTKYACDELLQPVLGEGSQAPHILAQSNVCQQLHWLMARVKVRPFVHASPETKVAPSPHLEWALEVLQRVRKKDTALLERTVGVKLQTYSDNVQGILDMLSDVGPRLQNEDEWLSTDVIESELQAIVGLAQVKTQLRNLRKSLKADARRREAGVHVPKVPPHHMVFVGNPGVGKTTMARLVSKILREVGATKGGRLIEAQREDLVGQHVGSTAPKTRKVINAAKGGVLFIDEAYRLTGYGSRDFGPEAVEEIMKDLDTGDPLVIIAGYENRMDNFFDANPGLRRRFRNHFRFSNYTPLEMAEMFWSRLRYQGFFVEPDITVECIAHLISDSTTEAWRAEHNGGTADLLFDNAKSNLDDRLCLDGATRWELQTFSRDDLRQAAASLQGDASSKL